MPKLKNRLQKLNRSPEMLKSNLAWQRHLVSNMELKYVLTPNTLNLHVAYDVFIFELP